MDSFGLAWSVIPDRRTSAAALPVPHRAVAISTMGGLAVQLMLCNKSPQHSLRPEPLYNKGGMTMCTEPAGHRLGACTASNSTRYHSMEWPGEQDALPPRTPGSTAGLAHAAGTALGQWSELPPQPPPEPGRLQSLYPHHRTPLSRCFTSPAPGSSLGQMCSSDHIRGEWRRPNSKRCGESKFEPFSDSKAEREL